MHHTTSIYTLYNFSLSGYLICLQVVLLLNGAVMDILMHVPLYTCAEVSLGYLSAVQFQGNRERKC